MTFSMIATMRTRVSPVGVAAMVLLMGCDTNPLFQQQSEARRMASDILVEFTKASDAANRSVMADTDEASVAFAGEAEAAKQAVEKDMASLKPLLDSLGYSQEAALLGEFGRVFTEYQVLDRTILELSVQNTNLKAQHLSFVEAGEAAGAFREAVEAVTPLNTKDQWMVKALSATAVLAVRDIQVLQASHIAERSETAMTGIEQRMATAESTGRGALAALAPIVHPDSRPRLALASAALDRFMGVNTRILPLSRRNTNVRSLALSLSEKGKLTAAGEASLRSLRDALAKRGLHDR